jgi:CRP-like cAMP-binding protein/CheY-like chemotaxis protein
MKKVLVIEDNEEILENTAEILELSHYKVFTALNGKLGIEQALTHKPDLILCDIMMPELDGYGVLHMLHNNPDLQDTPFIFLTAKAEQSEIRKGMSLGADDYIPKPFDTTDLLNAVETRLKKADQVQHKISEGLNGMNQLISIAGGDKALADFVEGRHTDKYKKRQIIFIEGNHPIRLYYIHKGKVKIYKTNNEGKELILRILNTGEFFGYIAMLEDTVYKANAEAMEDCEIAAIPRNEFEELMRTNPEVCRKFIKLLAKDVTEVEEHLLHIAYNSLRRKVADALLNIHKKYEEKSGDCSINISRENLAAVAGTATESLIRTLGDFKNEHLIDIKDGKIAILNLQKLERMVN